MVKYYRIKLTNMQPGRKKNTSPHVTIWSIPTHFQGASRRFQGSENTSCLPVSEMLHDEVDYLEHNALILYIRRLTPQEQVWPEMVTKHKARMKNVKKRGREIIIY